MYTLRTSETKVLTSDIVTSFFTMTPSPTERPLSQARLKYLQSCYDRGLFGPCHWASVWLGGTQFRMNGQHSSTLLHKLPEGVPSGLFVHLDTYEAETPEDMAMLFRQFDASASSRTARDVAGAYQHTYPNLAHLDPAVAKLGIEGITWYLRVIEGVPTGKGDDRYEFFRQPVYHDFLCWLDTVIDMKTPELKKIEVVAAMYATDLKAEDDARTFWADVARGGPAYEDQHPATVLDKWLKSCRDGTCGDKMKLAYHYQGCVFAWNASRQDKTIKDIRFTTSKGLYVPED